MGGIIAFSKDWNDLPTSGMHVPWQLGKTENLLWISSIGTRRPSLSSGRDLGRIWARLQKIWKQAENTTDNIWVKSPVLFPKASSSWQVAVNRLALKLQTARERKKLNLVKPEVWSFVPNAGDYIDLFGASIKIYYCVDDWSRMHSVDSKWIRQKEDELLEKCDLVFATSEKLVSSLSTRCNAPVIYAPHGVDYKHFSSAVNTDLGKPKSLEDISGPIVGFIGTLDARIDTALLRQLIPSMPEVSFVFVGPKRQGFCDELQNLSNAHFLGIEVYDTLPSYCQHFDCAIIPYDLSNPYNHSVNPIKVREFLAAGLRVVAPNLPELQGMQYVDCQDTPEGWKASIETALNQVDRRSISETMKGHSWAERVKALRVKVAEVSTSNLM